MVPGAETDRSFKLAWGGINFWDINGARGRVDQISLWAALTPTGRPERASKILNRIL